MKGGSADSIRLVTGSRIVGVPGVGVAPLWTAIVLTLKTITYIDTDCLKTSYFLGMIINMPERYNRQPLAFYTRMFIF